MEVRYLAKKGITAMDKSAAEFIKEKLIKVPVQPSREEKLLADIRNVCRNLDAAYARFEYESDDDLVESAIFEIESLKAKYRHLIKLAKDEKLENPAFYSVFSAERRELG